MSFLPEEQKQQFKIFLAVVFIVVFSFVLIVAKLGYNLRHPFEEMISRAKQRIKNNSAYTQNQTTKQLTDAELKQTDTDGDGISDYDEINVYRTSAYLEDTDSDGVLDLAEIQAGQDPLCATGQDCFGGDAIVSGDKSPVDLSVIMSDTKDLKAQADTLKLLQSRNGAGDMLKGDLSPAMLRKLLLAAGVSKEAVDAIDDKDLFELYQSSVSSK